MKASGKTTSSGPVFGGLRGGVLGGNHLSTVRSGSKATEAVCTTAAVELWRAGSR